MENCVFCKINKNEIKSEKLFENEYFFVIKSISPLANKHFLIIPKLHFAQLIEMDEKKAIIMKNIFENMPKLEKILDLTGGYRLVVNQGENAGQSVQHLHIHILAGQKLTDNFN